MTHNPDNISLRAYYSEDDDQPCVSIRESFPNPNDPEDVEIVCYAKVLKNGGLHLYQDTFSTPLYVFELVRLIRKNFNLLYRSLK